MEDSHHQTNAGAPSPRMAFALVLLCVPLSGVGVDLYAPSLPAISDDFGVSNAAIEWTLSVYIFGFGLSQFFVGPVSDALGRKPVIVVGAVINILASLGILVCTSLTQLLALRLVQGLSVSLISVPARAIMVDVFQGERLKSRVKVAAMAWGFSPIVSPFLGGYLQHLWGWHANFWFMAIYGGLILIATTFFFRETHFQRTTLSIAEFRRIYGTLARHPFFLRIVVMAALVYSYVIIFHLKAPFITQDTLKEPAVTYGHMALLMGSGWFIGNLLSSQTTRFPMLENMHFLLGAIFLILLGMTGMSWALPDNPWRLVVPVALIAVLLGIAFPHYMSIALAEFPTLGASANACYFAGIWTLNSLISWGFSWIPMTHTLALSLGYLGLTIFSWLFFACLVAPRHTKRGSTV